MRFILGKKLKMSQIFTEDNKEIPVTLIKSGPCVVVQIKTKDRDGYDAIQIGFERMKEDKESGKKLKRKDFRYLREFRTDNIKNFKEGDILDVSIFDKGDKISVSGISKGKGFQGGLKRWGFSSRGRTHGVKHERRTIGSTGIEAIRRVFKGKKMPGRMGKKKVTVKNLEIVDINREDNILAVKGAVPGSRGSILEIKTNK